MKKEEIESIVKKQREFFDSGKTHNTEFRINALKKLRIYKDANHGHEAQKPIAWNGEI